MIKKRYNTLISVGVSIVLIASIAFTVMWKMDFFKTKIETDGYLAYRPYEEMIEKSCLIVRGIVKEQSNPIRIRRAGSDDPKTDSLYTNHYLEVIDVLRGEAEIGKLIAVRTEGGEDATLIVESDLEPKIEIGDEVVAFLYRHTVGGSYTTQEDYYRIMSNMQGWYKRVEGEEKLAYSNPTAQPKMLIWEEIKTEIPALSAKYPINMNWKREEMTTRYKEGLESGEFTEEQYEQMMARMDAYGTVIHR